MKNWCVQRGKRGGNAAKLANAQRYTHRGYGTEEDDDDDDDGLDEDNGSEESEDGEEGDYDDDVGGCIINSYGVTLRDVAMVLYRIWKNQRDQMAVKGQRALLFDGYLKLAIRREHSIPFASGPAGVSMASTHRALDQGQGEEGQDDQMDVRSTKLTCDRGYEPSSDSYTDSDDELGASTEGDEVDCLLRGMPDFDGEEDPAQTSWIDSNALVELWRDEGETLK